MDLTRNATQWVIPAGAGHAIRVNRGERFRVVDLHGGQVGDLFAFSATETAEHLSASHTRTHTARLFPAVGENFVTDLRRPILTLVADTSPGRHDMLIAACDQARYSMLGASGHPSCADNMRIALTRLGISADRIPQPVNVFMNIPVGSDGELSWLAATSGPGDAVTFEAAMDCVVVVSACPMDLNPINGDHPTPLAVELVPTNRQAHEEI